VAQSTTVVTVTVPEGSEAQVRELAAGALSDINSVATYQGGLVLEENSYLEFDAGLSADGKFNGWVRSGTAGATLAFGDLCYLDPTDSRWELAHRAPKSKGELYALQ